MLPLESEFRQGAAIVSGKHAIDAFRLFKPQKINSSSS